MASDLTTANVRVYYDAPTGVEAGWVVRWDEVDEDGYAPIGHRSLDEPIGDEDTDEDTAVELAAARFGVDEGDVTVLR